MNLELDSLVSVTLLKMNEFCPREKMLEIISNSDLEKKETLQKLFDKFVELDEAEKAEDEREVTINYPCDENWIDLCIQKRSALVAFYKAAGVSI